MKSDEPEFSDSSDFSLHISGDVMQAFRIFTGHTSTPCEGEAISCHRIAHYVLIRLKVSDVP